MKVQEKANSVYSLISKGTFFQSKNVVSQFVPLSSSHFYFNDTVLPPSLPDFTE